MTGLLDLVRRFLTHDHAGGAQGALLPGRAQAGMIVLWMGASIPSGWAKCDGANGTPDLRGRFVRGASDGGSYPVGGTGGADSHDLSHTHGVGALATTSAGGHQHTASLAASTGDTHGVETGDASSQLAAHGHTHSATSDSQGGGTHAVSGATGGATASTSVDNRPPYVHYYWIQKL